MTAFENGYRAFTDMAGVNMAAFGGNKYVGNVENAIDELQKAINSLSKDGKKIDQLKGVAAEHWHAHTHNIDAAVKGVSAKAEVLESHVVGSVDIAYVKNKSFIHDINCTRYQQNYCRSWNINSQ